MGKEIDLEKLEKRVNALEDRLNNYSFLINLSQVLNIDKTIINEVSTYKTKARLYDKLQSGTQYEVVTAKSIVEDYRTQIRFLNALMELMANWLTRTTDKNLFNEIDQMIKSYSEMMDLINRH